MGFGRVAGAAVRRAVPLVPRRSKTARSSPRTAAVSHFDFRHPERFPELDCVARLLSPATIAAARERSARVGVGADRALITAGHISEEAYLRALGASLGVAFEPLDGIMRARCPVDDDRLVEGAMSGLLPLSDGDDLTLVVAPREQAVRRLIAIFKSNPALACRFRFTTSERLNRFALRHGAEAITARATDHLRQTFPALSAAPRPAYKISVPLTLAGVAAAASTIIAPMIAVHVLAVTLAITFLAWLGLRFAAAFIPAPPPPLAAVPDSVLPIYSVIAALYREAASIDSLLRSIERLDYPALGSKCTKPIVAI